MYKDKSMKEGTWGIKGKVREMNGSLKLALTKIDGSLKALSTFTVFEEDSLAYVCPGKTDKTKVKIPQYLKVSREELVSALPSGGVKITKKF
jgi:hypothetical protein